MHAREQVARNLAAALLAGAWTRRALLRRTWSILGPRSRSAQRTLIAELLESAPVDYPPSPEWLVAYFLESRSFKAASAAFDVLKATLHNCIKNGPAAENRAGLRDFRAHLNGRVGWVENVNPARAEKLRRMFDAITW